ncbi:amidohydrolase family protein [Rhodopila sp.]|uniref:amidohydrolase family protein n=1 Tax=Rhodopila sp. TaxID=2480087 RepID=UPI003D0B5DC3
MSVSFLGGLAVDVHTHVYSNRYITLLQNRTAVPRIVTRGGQDRMLILPGEDTDASTSSGRPIGSEYWDGARKLAFMDGHGIAVSVVSPANPWLDFLPAADAGPAAVDINEDMEALCAGSGGRLYGMGLLPRDPMTAAAELGRIARLPHLRGAAIGTTGAGKGLDDPALDPVWAAAERNGLMLFVHPHYGLGNEVMGGYGHAMALALGFPFETTTAITRLILGGTLDRFPGLKLMVAHAGGVLPYLAGRLDACVAGDAHSPVRLRHPPSSYLRMMHYDAIGYQMPTLSLLIALVGADRLLFGTDYPFFPPHVGNAELDTATWHSPTVHRAILQELEPQTASAILRSNAMNTFGLAVPASA